MARLPIAASLPAGTPVSKYFRNINVEDFMRTSSENVDGLKDVDDPALAMLNDECEVISKDELIARRREMVVIAEKGSHLSEEFVGNDPQESPCSDEAGEAGESSGHNADGLPTPCQSLESEEERQAREQEERLAALGVTGFAKPVRTSVRRSTVPSTPASSEDRETATSCGYAARDGSRCVSSQSSHETMANLSCSHASTGQRPDHLNDVNCEGYRGGGSPPPNQQAISLQTPPTSACHDSCLDNNENRTRGLPSNGAQNALTNSPVSAKYIHYDAPGVGKLQESMPRDAEGRKILPPSNTSGIGMRADSCASPSSDRSEQERFRKRSIREFSAEVDEGPKRQKDEGHQKEKRKAPKVAAAYR